jgi:hypothetical protein
MLSPTGDRGFESGFLQRGVSCEPDFLDPGAEFCQRYPAVFIPSGTEGSNPASSSGESVANLTSSIRAPIEQPS